MPVTRRKPQALKGQKPQASLLASPGIHRRAVEQFANVRDGEGDAEHGGQNAFLASVIMMGRDFVSRPNAVRIHCTYAKIGSGRGTYGIEDVHVVLVLQVFDVAADGRPGTRHEQADIPFCHEGDRHHSRDVPGVGDGVGAGRRGWWTGEEEHGRGTRHCGDGCMDNLKRKT